MTKKKHRNVRRGKVQDAGPARGVKGRHVKERPPPVKPRPDWLAAHVKGWPVAVAVVLLLGAFAAQAITSMRQKCTTFDEVAHLPAGYSYLKMGDFRMNPEHPPLGKMIAAVPLLFHNLDGAFDSRPWQTGDEWKYGREFIYGGRKGNDADTILFWGRFPMVALSLCLGLLVFFWARKLYGNAAGLFALFLFAFSPNIIAHGRLANTDVPIAFFVLLSLFCFDRALRRLTPLSAALAGVTLGLALLAKFSGLLMLPVFLIVAFIRLVDGSSMEVRFGKSFTVGMWRRKLPVMLVLFAVMIAITYGAVWAGYGFRYSAFLGEEERPLPRFASVTSREEGRPGAIFRFIHDNALLPQAYLEGFHCVRQTMQRYSFLDGRSNLNPGTADFKPWPHYFIMTSLYKTAVPALLFFVVAVVFARRMSRRKWKQETPLAVLFGVYFVVAMSSDMNIGHRHILPVVPLAIIFLSKIVNHLQGPKKSYTIVRSVVFGVLLVWCAYGTVSVHPNYLAYFNEIAGGPANGAKHLTDSNIDWGQDLILLKRYADNHGIKEMHLCYFGTGDPFYYKIPCKLLESVMDIRRHPPQINQSHYSEKIAMGDYVAVSVTHLMDTYPQGPEIKPILRHVRDWTPVAKIGYSIYLYRAEKEFDVKAVREKIIRMLDYKKRDEYLLLRRLGIEPGN